MHLLLAFKDALTTEKTEEMFLPWFTLFANVLSDIDGTIVNLEWEKANENTIKNFAVIQSPQLYLLSFVTTFAFEEFFFLT